MFEGAEGELELARGAGDVPVALLECLEEVAALEGGDGLVEDALDRVGLRGLERGELHFERQVGFRDLRLVADGDHALGQVLQFADVAGPRVALQHGERGGFDSAHHLAEPERVPPDEHVEQLPQILHPVAQGRQARRNHVDSVEEVLAEPPGPDGLGEIGVGGHHEAEIDPDRVPAAHALDLVLLYGAQQFGLQIEAQVADLVEEQRAAVGEFELAQLLPRGTREGAAFVAEQRALDEF